MHQTRTHSSGRLSVPSVTKPQQPSSSPEVRTQPKERNRATPSKRSQLSLIKLARTPSQRRPFRDELLSKDFSKLNPNYDREKYWEYCKALQTQAKDLAVENEQLHEDAAEQLKKQEHVPTVQKGTDKTLDSQKPPFDIDADELAVVFNSSDNKLSAVKGNDLHANYIQIKLPSFRWLGTNSLFLYFGYSSAQRSYTNLEDEPSFIVSRTRLESDPDQDLKLIRTINLGKLGFDVRFRRMLGKLQNIYIAPEPSDRHAPEMVNSTLS